MFRRLKILYIPFGLILFLLFHILYLRHRIAYAPFNILFLLLAPAGYIYSKNLSKLLVALSWIIFYPLFSYVYKIGLLNAALSIFIFNCLLIGFVKYKDIVDAIKANRESEIKEKDDSRRASLEEFEKLDALDGEIKTSELEILNLYEITRKMSGSLKFDDIFNIFSAFLKENFIFKKSEIVILKEIDNKGLGIERTYKILGGQEERALEPDIDYEKLKRLLLENRREVFLRRETDPALFETLGIAKGVEAFAYVPVLSEKRVVGILTAEDLPHVDFERFVILAMQFALEMKKVLLYKTVEELAITDSLTGLYVRRYFFERLNEELNRSRRYKFNFAFIMIDIDNFKGCNDTYGHLVGDVVLREIGHILKQSVREIDLVARYGGEEFSLVLPETERDGAHLVAERIRKRIEEYLFKAYDEELKLTISAGVSIYPKDSNEVKGLVEKADRALYVAKNSGKNLVCLYKKEYNKGL